MVEKISARLFKDAIIGCLAFISAVALAASNDEAETIDFASGTGALVDKTHIVTAFHVVYDSDEILVEFVDKEPIKATIEQKSAEEDWAVLRLESECDILPVSYTTDLQLGDRAYTLGYPSASLLGKSVKYTDGAISALSGMMDDKKTFQFSAPIQPGNSGGPIFDMNGRVVGIVQSCLDPEQFFKHTGGALPQAVNFGLKMQILLSGVKGVDFSQGESRTVAQNNKATCFVRTRQRISLRKIATNSGAEYRTNGDKATNVGSNVFDYSKVSQRYRQLAHYLENIASGGFTTLSGDAIDVSTKEGIAIVEENVENAYKYLTLEGLRLVLYQATDLKRSTIDSNTLDLCSKAKDAIWEAKKKNGIAKTKWKEQTFWGLSLGCSVKIVDRLQISKSLTLGSRRFELYIDNINQNGYYNLKLNEVYNRIDESKMAGRTDWPIFDIVCTRKGGFRGDGTFNLISSVDGKLIGVRWRGKRFLTDPVHKEIVELFERKYNIRFGRKLPMDLIYPENPRLPSTDVYLHFFDLKRDCVGRDGVDRTPYAYEDDYVRIYIRADVSGHEEVWVLLTGFEEILRQGKLKMEQERLNKPVEIEGSDSL